ncbi:MAG: type III PLP-dependent enzyme [Pseudomonadota bacterium]
MHPARSIHATPIEVLRRLDPDAPVLCFAPEVLQRVASRFLAGFPGLVSYAVKANPEPAILENLAAAGIGAYDVASVPEIELMRATLPGAVLHYNNPVRSRAEIARAVALGVRSFSLDSPGELARLIDLVPAGAEFSVRFKLEAKGAAYDFGAKFGAPPDAAAPLLAQVARAGFVPSLTFHPGTQCAPVAVWRAYVREAARIARAASVEIARLNVGGGFPAHRMEAEPPNLAPIFEAIGAARRAGFGVTGPDLVCEPGRGMVAECCSLLTRVRAVRGAHVFLNDGIYGGLAEMLNLPMTDRLDVLAPDGTPRGGTARAWTVFGPTCDSLDTLPGLIPLPAEIAEGDAVLVHAMGAYSGVTATRFNGFGALRFETVQRLA